MLWVVVKLTLTQLAILYNWQCPILCTVTLVLHTESAHKEKSQERYVFIKSSSRGHCFCFAASILFSWRKLSVQQWHVDLSEVTQVVLKLQIFFFDNNLIRMTDFLYGFYDGILKKKTAGEWWEQHNLVKLSEILDIITCQGQKSGSNAGHKVWRDYISPSRTYFLIKRYDYSEKHYDVPK